MKCERCGAELGSDDKYCPVCGQAVSENKEQANNVCPNCGKTVKPFEKFCGSCGYQNPYYDESAPTEEKVFSENSDAPKEKVKMWKAYSIFWKNTFNYKDKSDRPYFWYPVLVNLLIAIIIGSITGWIPALQYNFELWGTAYSGNYIVQAFYLAIFLPELSCTIRRLRDAGKEPMNVLFYFLPIVGWIMVLVWLTKPSDTYL